MKDSTKLIKQLIDDLEGRRGFDGIITNLDDDIKKELISQWRKIIVNWQHNIKDKKHFS